MPNQHKHKAIQTRIAIISLDVLSDITFISTISRIAKAQITELLFTMERINQTYFSLL